MGALDPYANIMVVYYVKPEGRSQSMLLNFFAYTAWTEIVI